MPIIEDINYNTKNGDILARSANYTLHSADKGNSLIWNNLIWKVIRKERMDKLKRILQII